MGAERTVVVPPSRSFALAVPLSRAPVTRFIRPDVVVPSWRGWPPSELWSGLPRCQPPRTAVSVPVGLTVQPRPISRSSWYGPQWVLRVASPRTVYGHQATFMNHRIADRLRATWGAIFSSGA